MASRERKLPKRKIRAPHGEQPIIAPKPTRVFPELLAWNDRQEEYITALNTHNQVFVTGPAGTSKTYIASRYAMKTFMSGDCERIIIGRATVSKRKHELGAQPGNEAEKLERWMVPFFDGFRDEVSQSEITKMRILGNLEFAAFETLRGRTFKNAVVILTEAASCDLGDLHLFLTRTGEGTRVIVEGDIDQPDIPDSGYAKVLQMITDYKISAKVIIFDESHVVRDPRVKEWVRAFRLENTQVFPQYHNNTTVEPIVPLHLQAHNNQTSRFGNLVNVLTHPKTLFLQLMAISSRFLTS